LKEQLGYWAVNCAARIARNYSYRGNHDLADDPRFKAFLRNKQKLPV
jgi:hypothetical protein